jgi:N-acetylmuramoyl-L-alanine amidase
MKIAIFPGHVGKDSGAIDRVQGHEDDKLMSIEAVLNGQVANLLKVKLDLAEINSEIYIGSFNDRINNSKDCDFGISLHCDAFNDADASGYTIFHYPNSRDGIGFSKTLNYELENFIGHKIKSRGIKPHSYYILSKTRFPCILLEMGFLTNSTDEGLLNQFKTQNTIAHCIFCSIMHYIEMKE